MCLTQFTTIGPCIPGCTPCGHILYGALVLGSIAACQIWTSYLNSFRRSQDGFKKSGHRFQVRVTLNGYHWISVVGFHIHFQAGCARSARCYCPVDLRLPVTQTLARQDRWHPVWLAAAGGWYAARVLPRPTDVCHRDWLTATGLCDPQVCRRYDDGRDIRQISGQLHAVIRWRTCTTGNWCWYDCELPQDERNTIRLNSQRPAAVRHLEWQSGTPVERVATFKLLGVHVANDLKWLQHVDAISSKVSSRLHFLKQLKRSGAGPEDLLYFYVITIRPVLEYACPAWHSRLTAAQTKALESLQRRAMKIIFPDKDYWLSLIFASVDTLESRREQLTERFFLPTLPAPGQTGLSHHRQITTCKNICVIFH